MQEELIIHVPSLLNEVVMDHGPLWDTVWANVHDEVAVISIFVIFICTFLNAKRIVIVPLQLNRKIWGPLRLLSGAPYGIKLLSRPF